YPGSIEQYSSSFRCGQGRDRNHRDHGLRDTTSFRQWQRLSFRALRGEPPVWRGNPGNERAADAVGRDAGDCLGKEGHDAYGDGAKSFWIVNVELPSIKYKHASQFLP